MNNDKLIARESISTIVSLRGAFVETAFTPDQIDAAIAQDSQMGVLRCTFMDGVKADSTPVMPSQQALLP
jgi:hypothetical protein